MKNRILAIASILLIFVAFFWYRYEQSLSGSTWAEYQSAVGGRSEALEKEKSTILKELSELEALYSERMSGNAFFQILCSEPRSMVYKTIYPAIAEHDMTAILNVSIDAMPGDKGCMTVKQAQKLITLGWELCLEYDTSYGSVDAWYEAITKRIQPLNIEAPRNVYFRKSVPDEKMFSQFGQLGLTRYFYRDTAFGFYEPVNENNPYWQINAVSWNKKGVKDEMITAIENGGDLIFVLGFEEERELYDETPFSTMLRTIKENEENGKLILASFNEVEERRSEAASKYAAWLNEMLEEKERLEQELKDVKAELQELY